MKKYRLLTTLKLTLLLLLFTTSAAGQKLSINIHNKTGHHVDSFAIANKYVGSFPKDTSISLQFDSFGFDSGYPYEHMRGIVNGEVVENLRWSWCGTEREQKEEGKYSFDLTLRGHESNKSYLYLDFTRQCGTD